MNLDILFLPENTPNYIMSIWLFKTYTDFQGGNDQAKDSFIGAHAQDLPRTEVPVLDRVGLVLLALKTLPFLSSRT